MRPASSELKTQQGSQSGIVVRPFRAARLVIFEWVFLLGSHSRNQFLDCEPPARWGNDDAPVRKSLDIDAPTFGQTGARRDIARYSQTETVAPFADPKLHRHVRFPPSPADLMAILGLNNNHAQRWEVSGSPAPVTPSS